MSPTLTPDRIANELLVEVLLTQEQKCTALAVIALGVHKRPEMAPLGQTAPRGGLGGRTEGGK
jgi:hypothetical protein